MSRIASYFLLAAMLSTAACSDDPITVGKSSQEIKKKKNGKPTGDGNSCSWQGTVAYDVATGEQSTTAAPKDSYKVGDHFKSLDGCNDCSCTPEGIRCTMLACADSNPGPACASDAKQCPDGSFVGRTGPNCEFAPCPSGIACESDAKQCPDGSFVGRTGPNCEFAPCPSDVACPSDALQCPDGSFVGRTGPNCTFAPCPSSIACPSDALQCPDGSFVGRTGPNCTFAPCP